MSTNIVIGSGLQVGGAVTFSNNFSVSGISTLTGDVDILNNLSISGNLSVTGSSTLTGDVSLSNNLSVSGTTTLTGDVEILNNLTVVGNINLTSIETKGSVNIDIPQTTITGTTSGSLICSMPYQGTSYKKVIIYCNGYENDTTTVQTYSFPTPFLVQPYVNINQSGLPGTVTTESISFSPDVTTIYTGFFSIRRLLNQ